jgi:hypothetical protein
MDTVTYFWDIVAYMTLRGVLAGAALGTLYGTLLMPIVGSIFGLAYGGILGLVLGFVNGLLIAALTWLLSALGRTAHYSQIVTLFSTLITLYGGVVGFSQITGQSVFQKGASSSTLNPGFALYIGLPALIAALAAGWVSQGLARRYEYGPLKRKAKPKRGETPAIEGDVIHDY